MVRASLLRQRSCTSVASTNERIYVSTIAAGFMFKEVAIDFHNIQYVLLDLFIDR